MNTTSAPPDPQTDYGSPEELLRDTSLSVARKRALLQQWHRDLTQMQMATEENMPRSGAGSTSSPVEGGTADLLQRVSNCLLALENG